MDRLAAPSPAPDLQLTLRPVPSAAEKGPAAEAAEQRMAEHAAALRNDVLPNKLQVTLDEAAQRFVQTLTDVDTAETVRRYPSESQLAYSRAIMVYMRAMSDVKSGGES